MITGTQSYNGTHRWMLSFREEVGTKVVTDLCNDLSERYCPYQIEIDTYGLTVFAELACEDTGVIDEYDWALSTICDLEQKKE